MTHHPSVSVCFPVYNEEGSIGEVLEEAHSLLRQSGLDYEILVCDDGSTDQTKAIVENIASLYPNFRIIHNPHNLGIRPTFEMLYSEARKDFVFLNSADRQWRTSILFEMLPLTREWDIIVASRRKKFYDPFRGFVSIIFNAIPFMFFGVHTFDAGAVKLVKREIIESFNLISRSPFSEAERLIRASKAGYRITEYPVDISPRKIGRQRGMSLKALIFALTDVVRVFIALSLSK